MARRSAEPALAAGSTYRVDRRPPASLPAFAAPGPDPGWRGRRRPPPASVAAWRVDDGRGRRGRRRRSRHPFGVLGQRVFECSLDVAGPQTPDFGRGAVELQATPASPAISERRPRCAPASGLGGVKALTDPQSMTRAGRKWLRTRLGPRRRASAAMPTSKPTSSIRSLTAARYRSAGGGLEPPTRRQPDDRECRGRARNQRGAGRPCWQGRRGLPRPGLALAAQPCQPPEVRCPNRLPLMARRPRHPVEAHTGESRAAAGPQACVIPRSSTRTVPA